MACTHLRKLYQLCQEQELFFSGSDLVRIVCKECGSEEVCPSSLILDDSTEETSAKPDADEPQETSQTQ